MTADICGTRRHETGLPDAGGGGCCWGAATLGPDDCTCWQTIYDLDQQPVQPAGGLVRDGGTFTPAEQPRMCGDCAYRPGSPEKQGSDQAAADSDHLERLAHGDRPFWCHQGLRRPIALQHPTGEMVTVDNPLDYQPPVTQGVPYQADGQPALVCAGWAARRRALIARDLA